MANLGLAKPNDASQDCNGNNPCGFGNRFRRVFGVPNSGVAIGWIRHVWLWIRPSMPVDVANYDIVV